MKNFYIFTIVLLIIIACSQLVIAQIPRTISYQGILADNTGTPKPDGSYQLTFRLYDVESGGSPLWTEVKTLMTTRGLFSTALGDQVPIPYSIKFDKPYWLGIQVASDPELTPRIKFHSVGYSLNSSWADTARVGLMSIEKLDTLILGSSTHNGRLIIYKNGSSKSIVESGNYGGFGGSVIIKDEIGKVVGQFRPSTAGTGGIIEVFRDTLGNRGFYAAGNYYGDEEGYMSVYGSQRSAIFYMGASNNSSVELPDSSISAAEILDEPGIAQGIGKMASIQVGGTTSMIDIETTTLTIPAPGYIVVEATGQAGFSGSTTGNMMYCQIDETAGGSYNINYQYNVGFNSDSPAGYTYIPVTMRRTYYKDAGTYTFRFEAMDANGTGNKWFWNTVITATYYPTSYGTVETAISAEALSEFQQTTPIINNGNGGEYIQDSRQSYKVDLRELELKAAKARAEAEKAERELLEAKLKGQNGSDSDDKR